jgi:hypothetical protein
MRPVLNRHPAQLPPPPAAKAVIAAPAWTVAVIVVATSAFAWHAIGPCRRRRPPGTLGAPRSDMQRVRHDKAAFPSTDAGTGGNTK